MSGFYIVRLDPIGNTTDKKIWRYTKDKGVNPQDKDATVAVDFQVGGYMRFSNSLFTDSTLLNPGATAPGAVAPTFVSVQWDPPGDVGQEIGPSQHTYFDNQPLSSRSESYQETAIEWFADFVLAGYLRSRRYIVEPTTEVLAALDGQLPKGLEDIARLAKADPALLNYVQCYENEFSPEQLSPAAREAIQNLLEDQTSLNAYLGNAAKFVGRWGDQLPQAESQALIRAAADKPNLIRRAFDSVELGRARGDGNTYVLIGVDPTTNQPRREWLMWVVDQLSGFVTQNGFMPAFGCFVTEARMRYRVILGPGVTDREKDFLALFGHQIIDKSHEKTIGYLGSTPPDSTASQTA